MWYSEKPTATTVASILLLAMILVSSASPGFSESDIPPGKVKHIVVIFQENVSFDHYFATYPQARNEASEPQFMASSKTPSVNGVNNPVMHSNRNIHQPFRLDRSQNYTCDQNHDYTPEQQAFDSGLMDLFVQTVGVGDNSCPDYGYGPGLVMGYYDGNTVTALWNYAQHFAMSDNSYGTTFGPSTPGVLNLVAGNTAPYDKAHAIGDLSGSVVADAVIGDPDPYYDDCGSPAQLAMQGRNVGDLLNAKGVSWGWFQGGFAPTVAATSSTPAVCGSQSARLDGTLETDYSAHHEPFQYYASTANPHHLPPSSVSGIGHQDQANHQYDLSEFWKAVDGGNMPAVSFLKAKRAHDAHAGYSSPLDEQVFLVETLNALQLRPEWSSTVVIIAYDDSDGWYDHQIGPIVSHSVSPADALTGTGHCGNENTDSIAGRCGYGPRLPLLVISPFAKRNFVDSSTTDQSSILRFIEDSFALGRIGNHSFDAKAGLLSNLLEFDQPRSGRLILDAYTGESK